jgi:hypothetical protein
MKIGRQIVIVLLLAIGGGTIYAQPMDTRINKYLYDFGQIGTIDGPLLDISDFTAKLEQKHSPGNTIRFSKLLFNRTRQEFFRRYTQYATFSETLSNGKYNCLTGTALYALLLHHFGIDYTIIETNYHIFLLANTDDGQVLFEATDPINGFITDAKEISQRIEIYKRNTPQGLPEDGKKYYTFMTELYQPVSLRELQGLLHYNVSTEAYNNQNFSSAINHLDKALDLYNSPRIAEFTTVLMRAIVQSKFDVPSKELYISQLKSIRKKLPVMASSNNQF